MELKGVFPPAASGHGASSARAAGQTAAEKALAKAQQELEAAEKLASEEAKAEVVEEQQEASQTTDILDIRQDKDAFTMSSYKERFTGPTTSKPKDDTMALTSRLVMANTNFAVQAVMGEASSSMISLRMTAALDKGENGKAAKAIIRKLEKLIARGRKKIANLDDEAMLAGKKKKADTQKQQKRAEEIKQELRKRQQVRMAKEHAYLQEAARSGVPQSNNPQLAQAKRQTYADMQRLSAKLEAQIAAIAEAMAAAEVAAEAMPGGGEGGGEVVVAAGAEGGSAPVAEGGGAGADAGAAEGGTGEG